MSKLERTTVILDSIVYKVNVIPLMMLRSDNAQRIADSIWALKLEGITNPSQKEIEQTSGISRKTLLNEKDSINELLDAITNFPQSDTHIGMDQSVSKLVGSFGEVDLLLHKTRLTDIEKIALSLGFSIYSTDLNLKVDGAKAKEYLINLLIIALRELKVLNGTMSKLSQLKYAEHFLGFFCKVEFGNGRVWSKDKDRSWFYKHDNNKSIGSLLVKDSSYSTITGDCMKFKATQLCEDVIKRALELFKLIEFSNSGSYNSKLHILVANDLISKIKFKDAITLLNNTVGYIDGSFIVDLNLQDTMQDRVYSIFTSISSETRKALGYINYDIGAALQTIALKLVEDEIELYPLHKELVDDKYSFRNKVMETTGKDLKWVKKELSKLDNMESYSTKIAILEEYFQESRCLRSSIIERLDLENDNVLYKAKLKASDLLVKNWDELKKEYQFTSTGEKKESSVFFFIWTQYERMIREAMKIPFANRTVIIDVHDAIYSKEDIDIALLEESVRNNTGFEVKISH